MNKNIFNCNDPEAKYLITTDNWFAAPDGFMYQSVWGKIQIFEDTTITGIKTNRNSSNRYMVVGNKGKAAIIAGCQIHYAVRSDSKPNTNIISDYTVGGGIYTEYERPSKIYIAE